MAELKERVCARELCGGVFVPGNPRQRYCTKRCGSRESARRHYAEHRDERLEYTRCYKAEHRAEFREYQRSYYARHREERSEYDSRYYWEHRDEERERNRRYQQTPKRKQRQRERAQIKRDALLAAVGKLVCRHCGRKLNRKTKFPDPLTPTVDHIQPHTLGGTDDTWNLGIACWGCNRDKGAYRAGWVGFDQWQLPFEVAVVKPANETRKKRAERTVR